MSAPVVKKRDVVFICGYEIAPPEIHHRRFERELALMKSTWNVAVKLSPPTLKEDKHFGEWTLETSGPDWKVDTNYKMFWWGDLIATDFEMSTWKRLKAGLAAFFDFTFSGALIQYFRMNWRYALFFLYPYALFAGFGVGAYLASRYAFGWFAPGSNWSLPVSILLGIAASIGSLMLPPRPLYIAYLFNDWHFAHELVHGRRTVLEPRLNRFAQELAGIVKNSTADEIVIVGHSLGAVQVMDVVARAKKLDPEFARKSPPVRILTIGSSLLKIGLHPGARFLREATLAVANDPNIYWVEFQALADMVNFYKSNPVMDMDLPRSDSPIVQIVRIKHMLTKKTYDGLKRDFFRVHRQFVLGNEVRYFYDYYMICCGPIALPDRVSYHDGATKAFAADGSFDPLLVRTGSVSGSVKSKKAKD